MRWVICAVVVFALAPSALADDFVLRGPQPGYHWGGFYGGGQIGYSSAVINFGEAGSSEIGFILRNTTIEQDQNMSKWTVIGSRNPTSVNMGGFIGYNYEWENIIVGLEVNYNHYRLAAAASDSITRSFSDSAALPAGHHYFYTVTVGAAGSLLISDIATFRARAGWEADKFLPYGFFGLAIGRTNITNAGTVSYTAVDFPDSAIPPLTPLDPLAFGPVTLANQQNNAFAYGITTGVGADVALTSHLFVRGEYEFVHFFPIEGTQVNISNVRVGAGFKF